MLAFARVSTHHIQRMHFSDIPRAVAVAVALTLLPCAAFAQADEDPDEPAASAPATDPDPAPEAPPAPATPPPSDPGAAGPVEVTPPPETGPETPADAALTWTALGAQQRAGDGLVTAAFGFTGLAMGSYHYAVSDQLALGVAGGFDYGRYVPDFAFTAGGLVALSLKLGMPVDGDTRLGFRADLGLLVPETPGVAVTIDLSANLMAPVAEGLYAGAGVDVPLTLGIHDGGTTLAWPLLFGGVVEYRVLAPLAIFAEAKLGPSFVAQTGGGVYFAMKLMAGVAYRL